jgi:hypothetical protein
MSNTALQYSPEDLLTAVIQERLDAIEHQTRLLQQQHRGALSRHLLELQTLGSLASALSGFLGELDGELCLATWTELQVRASRVASAALEASRRVLTRARSHHAGPATLAKVVASAEAVRGLREDLILVSLRSV